MLWWVILVLLVDRFRDKFDEHAMRVMNRIAGVAIGGFGMVTFLIGIIHGRLDGKGESMARPLVLIHGYSAEGKDMENLKQALVARGLQSKDINICNYVSLNNEVTIKDIAEGLDRAFRKHDVFGNETQEFDAIVHSTGMLVLRAWLANGGPPATNPRLKRLKHLIGLAPATWGSPQAHKGRTWLGAMVKGNRDLGPDFLNAGDRVLEGLELGSKFTWDLSHVDLVGPEPFYGKGTDTPFVAVFIGNTPYEGLASVANDPGTDGTVRWAGCGLNARKVTIDLTRIPVANANRLSHHAVGRRSPGYSDDCGGGAQPRVFDQRPGAGNGGPGGGLSLRWARRGPKGTMRGWRARGSTARRGWRE